MVIKYGSIIMTIKLKIISMKTYKNTMHKIAHLSKKPLLRFNSWGKKGKISSLLFMFVFVLAGIYIVFSGYASHRPVISSPLAGSSILGVVPVNVKVDSSSKTLKGKLYINGLTMPGTFVYSRQYNYSFKSSDGTMGINLMTFNKGDLIIVAEIDGIKSAPITVKNTGTARIYAPYTNLTYARQFYMGAVIDLPVSPTSVKIAVDGVELPGKVISTIYGWLYQAADGTLTTPALNPGMHTIQYVINGGEFKSWPVSVNVSDTLVVKINSPTNGQTSLPSKVDPSMQIDNPQQNISLIVDGKTMPGAIKYLPFAGGWKYQNQDGSFGVYLPDGIHTLQIDNAGAKSAIIFISIVSSATSTWGDHMGVVLWASRENIYMAKALGVKWVAISWEQNWGTFDNSIIAYAHELGLKVRQTCQKAPHSYTKADASSFAAYCASWVDKGVDAIEIGNEWNHEPFWNNPSPNGDYTVQANIMDATVKAIRAKSAIIPIITTGWSSGTSPNLPYEAIGKVLDASDGTIKTNATYIGNHPYAYNCDSPLLCDYPNRRDWNAFLGTKDVYAQAAIRGFAKPIWFTEIGGPSGGGKNLYTGADFTKASQKLLFEQYIQGIIQMRNAGYPIDNIFWISIQDGQNATTPAEEYFGLYDRNWNIKPAGTVVKNQSSQAW